jgi:hypothetical protein
VKDEMRTREALLMELSPAMREAVKIANDLKALCKNNQLSLAAIVSEELARSIDCLARRLFAVARQGEEQ